MRTSAEGVLVAMMKGLWGMYLALFVSSNLVVNIQKAFNGLETSPVDFSLVVYFDVCFNSSTHRSKPAIFCKCQAISSYIVLKL